MEEHVAQLQEELNREKEESSSFQLERDKVYSSLEDTQREIEEVMAEQKNTNEGMKEDERRHRVKIKVRWTRKQKLFPFLGLFSQGELITSM